MGYFSLNHQIHHTHILESLLTPMKHSESSLRVLAGYLEQKKVEKVFEIKQQP